MEEEISDNEAKVRERTEETNTPYKQSSIDMDRHQKAKGERLKRLLGNASESVSSTKAVSAEKSNLEKKMRPKMKAALKTKFRSHNSESDKTESTLIFEACLLNCVLCTKNFKELVDLESHVRSHDEVIHFSLVLKPLEGIKQERPEKSPGEPVETYWLRNKKKPFLKCEVAKKSDQYNVVESAETVVSIELAKGSVETGRDDANSGAVSVQDFSASDILELAKGSMETDEGDTNGVATSVQDFPAWDGICDRGRSRKSRGDRKKQIAKLSYVLMKRKTRGRPSHALKCPECDEVIKSKLAMILHYRTAHRRRGHNTKTTCDVCEENFASVKVLKEHLNEKHDLNLSAHNKIYKCTFCDEFCDRKSSLLMHKKTVHPGQTNYMCDDCGKKCHTPSELSIHRRMHTGEKPYQCDQCQAKFRFTNSLKEHMRLHTGEQPFQCDICGAKFARQCNKRRHMISHTGKFSHSCEYCGKGFNDVGPLKIHIRMHTGERPFQCDMCEMKFVTKAQMQCHKAKHTQIRSYLCQICGAAFLYSVDLRRHTKIHTGIRNYKCNECNAAFFRLDHLKRHQRSHAANSKRLANTEWKPRPTSQKQLVKSEAPLPEQKLPLVTPVINQEVGVIEEPTVQHVCIVCSAMFSTDDQLQHHMMVHMKQNNVAYVTGDIVQGTTISSVGDSSSKDVNSQSIYQQISTEETNNICTVCNMVIIEPNGLKQHLESVHQLQ